MSKVWHYKVIREPAGEWIRESLPERPAMTAPHQIVTQFGEWYETLPNEVPVALILNNKNQLDGYHIISTGSADAAVVVVGDVYRALLLAGAVRWIFVHNHPSGDPTPSKEDRAITRQLKAAGELLRVPLLDAVVIGVSGRYHSFSASGEFS